MLFLFNDINPFIWLSVDCISFFSSFSFFSLILRSPSFYERSNSGYAIKPKTSKRQSNTKMQWNTLQVSLFYSFHLRKSKFYRYLAFADLSNIFLIQSLSWSLLHFQRSPITRHRRFTYGFVNYITPFPRNVSLCRLWGEGYIFGPSHKLGGTF